MRLAFLKLFNEANWAAYAIDQAMILADKLVIGEGSTFAGFPDIPERSDDGTLGIINYKQRQYPGRIEVFNMLRKYDDYRMNMRDSYNHALTFCNVGDYFIVVDADEFFADEWLKEADKLMESNEVDLVSVHSLTFAFGFKWLIDFGLDEEPRSIIIKKTRELHFVPTAKRVGAGKNRFVSTGINRFHYMWLKPKARMRVRMQTSGRYPNMVGWLEENWDRFKLKEGARYRSYNGEFTLRRYEGEHPSILGFHPWRNVEDIRRIERK